MINAGNNMRGPNISISKGGALGGPGTQRGAQSHRGSGRGVGVQPSPLCEERACMHAKLLQSRLAHATLWTIARQALLSMEFSKQEYWDGLPCPSPGDFPDPGIELVSLSLLHCQAGFSPLAPPGKPLFTVRSMDKGARRDGRM